MSERGILIEKLPKLNSPLLVASFDGWGNALNVASGTTAYLVSKLDAQPFATVEPDPFYRFDEHRPVVSIEGGWIESLSPPGGTFYAGQTPSEGSDLVVLRAYEPNLAWFRFTRELLDLCEELGAQTLVTLGGLYDNVLHTDRVLSGVTSSTELLGWMREHGVGGISYKGPSAIHSVIHSEGRKRGLRCASLWSHCPHYLQGTVHFGLMAHMVELLGQLGGFELDTGALHESWSKLSGEIEKAIAQNRGLQEIVEALKKMKAEGVKAAAKASMKTDEKVINLRDFFATK